MWGEPLLVSEVFSPKRLPVRRPSDLLLLRINAAERMPIATMAIGMHQCADRSDQNCPLGPIR